MFRPARIKFFAQEDIQIVDGQSEFAKSIRRFLGRSARVKTFRHLSKTNAQAHPFLRVAQFVQQPQNALGASALRALLHSRISPRSGWTVTL